MYSVGEHLTIQCTTQCNPSADFIWSFRSHNKSEEEIIEPSSDKSNTVVKNLKATDSGTYICTSVNPNRLNAPNASAFITVFVRNLGIQYHDCDRCGYIDICQIDHGMTICTPNTWVPIAIMFISLSTAFAVITIILIWQRKTRQKRRVDTQRTVISQR